MSNGNGKDITAGAPIRIWYAVAMGVMVLIIIGQSVALVANIGDSGLWDPLDYKVPQLTATPRVVVSDGAYATFTGVKCNHSDEVVNTVGAWGIHSVDETTYSEPMGSGTNAFNPGQCKTETFNNPIPPLTVERVNARGVEETFKVSGFATAVRSDGEEGETEQWFTVEFVLVPE